MRAASGTTRLATMSVSQDVRRGFYSHRRLCNTHLNRDSMLLSFSVKPNNGSSTGQSNFATAAQCGFILFQLTAVSRWPATQRHSCLGGIENTAIAGVVRRIL